MIGLYDEPIDMSHGVTQGWASTKYRNAPGFKLETLSLPLDMLSGRLPGGGAQLMRRLLDYRHMALWVQATRAQSVGSVRAGPLGRSTVRYTLDRADMQRLVAGLGAVARMHFAVGARAVVPCVHGLPYALGPDELHLLDQAPLDPRAYVAILSHLFGGCVMGRDEHESVCDVHGRVHGHPGLYVVDASVIPSNLGVNPQHTIMALARHFAERML
jgi:choline dehydrogenase-like flavoprotein